MQKGASTANMKSAPLDDDIGKDFFNSWKSSKLGNDTVDFNMETLPKNKKSSFNFDELDNFELSGNFDKLSSFKLDVPDLDFSGLSGKNEKINEYSSKELVVSKKDSKEKFSFDFDFNCFDLDSKSAKEKRPVEEPVNNAIQHSSECNPDRSTDRITKDEQCSDFSQKMEVLLNKRAVIAEAKEKETSVTTTAYRGNSHKLKLPKEKSASDDGLCHQSFSGDHSDQASLPSSHTGIGPLIVKPRTTIEKGDSMQKISTLPSRSSSPADSYNSGCLTKSTMKEVVSPNSEFQKHQGQNFLNKINGSLIGTIQTRKAAFKSSLLKKPIQGVKNIEEKHNSEQNLIQSPLGRSDLNTSTSSHQLSMSAKKTSTSLYQISPGAKNVADYSIRKPATNPVFAPKISSAVKNTASVKVYKAKAKLISSTRLGSQTINSENTAGAGFDNDNPCGNFASAVPITIQANTSSLNSTMLNEVKLPALDKRMEYLTNVASKAASSANIDTRLHVHTPVKRKIDKELIADMEKPTPKCTRQSSIDKRNILESSPNAKLKPVSHIKSTEGLSSLEDDENLLKAESLTKELDGICCTLRKKYSEGKQVQVRSLINNAALLLLSVPLQAEKIIALEKFASDLLGMEF